MRRVADLRPLGATVTPEGTEFRVWAPEHERLELVLYGGPSERTVPMRAEDGGYWAAQVAGVDAGARYRFRLPGGPTLPDPAARALPEGVHGPAEVVDPDAFRWTDAAWRGVPLEEMVLYELHVGTATPEGTFDALIPRLDALVELGVTALEIMPVASFSGARNWGYDGVALFAPAAPYGGPEGLRRLVDAAHAGGLAVVLDVVYNHFGPEGNYLPAFTSGRFFTDRHETPWGAAVNYDAKGSEAVRGFVIQNALHWAREYHVDGLRLDATHAILDDSEVHVLRELGETVRAALPPERHFVLIAEDERNERLVVTPAAEGGLGLDAVWADDFHHQVRRLTAGDDEGYYADYAGTADDLAATLRRGWFYAGQHSAHRGGPRGTEPDALPPPAFVHAIQNHDQVGNRAFGERLNHQIAPGAYRAASALLLLSPYTPLLWMGQEWAASTPFLYFTDHPEELGRLVTEGRRREFAHFSAFRDPARRDAIPDPQAEETFLRSKLRWDERTEPPHAGMLELYRTLLRLRRTHPALRRRDRASFQTVAVGEGAVALRREGENGTALLLVAALTGPATVDLHERRETRAARWHPLLGTEQARFTGAADDVLTTLDMDGTLTLPSAGALVLEAD